jgi:hypothetical protein
MAERAAKTHRSQETPHGFRNIGDVPLLVVSVHERGTMRQAWLGRDPE